MTRLWCAGLITASTMAAEQEAEIVHLAEVGPVLPPTHSTPRRIGWRARWTVWRDRSEAFPSPPCSSGRHCSKFERAHMGKGANGGVADHAGGKAATGHRPLGEFHGLRKGSGDFLFGPSECRPAKGQLRRVFLGAGRGRFSLTAWKIDSEG